MSEQLYLNIDKNLIYDNDEKYEKNIKIPQYIPSNNLPNINQLVNIKKFYELKQEILKSNVSKEEKNFLIFAASRHLIFNYSLIADYYANSNKEMQHLMEKSALVLIDFDDALANGYVDLSSDLQKILNKQKNVIIGDNND